ncbi:MAG TPA: GNAT family N-acetyltransferase [Thermoplasmata archaeon]|jgi:ribosomal protein S18 acetylase RimI-like enzyme|nr:GNAT family N-acetyltransferase [Thermoplasmata archaeon]
MAEVSVRTLTRDDIPWAIALTDTEGWGYTEADFQRLLHLEPEGVFLAESLGERIGITATTAYGKLAYIGAVIVDAKWRGKHVGEALMNACLEFLDRRGVASARLNAYLNVIPFYERLGFRKEFENHRYAGENEGRVTPGARLMREDDLEAVGGLDRPYFGADRLRLLARLLHEFPKTSLVLDDRGEVVAFAFGNTGGGSCEIGPFVCPPSRAREAEDLLYAMFAAADLPCAFSLPAVNEQGVAAARRAGLRETFRTLRMVRGSREFGGDPAGIFALAGLEKG